jgi:hypothetical protein
MVNEEIYQKMAADLKTAENSLLAALDMQEFAKTAGIPITTNDADLKALKDKISTIKAALLAKGISV